MRLFFFALLPLFSISAFASKAQIRAIDDENVKYVIALDENEVPRIDSDTRSYPSIKSFDERAYDFESFCIEGSDKDIRALLEALVDAANGDGDSYATLESIEENDDSVYEVVAMMTDESGENEKTFEIPLCK